MLLFICSCLFLFGCTHYQYLDYSSGQNQLLTDGTYTFENDSIRFVYRFYGLNTVVSLTIENKTKDPIFIDWKHSGLVYNGIPVELNEDRTKTTTIFTRNPHDLLNNNRTEITTEQIRHNINSNMLLPTAQLRNDSIVILRSREIDLKENPPSTMQIIQDQNGNLIRHVHVYDLDQSPMRFQFFFNIKFGIKQDVSQSYTHPFFLRHLNESNRHAQQMKVRNASYIRVNK